MPTRISWTRFARTVGLLVQDRHRVTKFGFVIVVGINWQDEESVRFDAVHELIQLQMRDEKVPSIVVGVVHDNKQLWTEGFGWADREQRLPATIHTP